MRKTSQTGVETDELLPVAHRRDQRGRSGYQLRPMVGWRPYKPEERRIRKFTSHLAHSLCATGSNQRSAFRKYHPRNRHCRSGRTFARERWNTGISEINEKTDLNISLE